MNLTGVRYQDSCIYIGLNGSQNKRENGAFQQEIRNMYVVYKIKAFDRQVRETVLIGRRDILVKEQKIILKFELDQLQHPEECEFEIISLKFNFVNGKVKELKIGRSFRFLALRYSTRVDFPREEPSKKIKINNKREIKAQNKTQTTKAIVVAIEPKKEKFEEIKITPRGFTIIEEITQISTIVAKVESTIQNKIDAQTKKLDRDIKRMCYEAIDLLLSNLPLPELVEEYRASNAMIKSIHRYINTELLQNQYGGGESI